MECLFRTAIRHAQLLPSLPPVTFKRDNFRLQRDEINHLLDIADKGPEEETAISTKPVERSDLYDSDRTKILQKLSNEASVDESNDNETLTNVNQLSPEQLQRRMKAFALTKRMKRIQEQRSAVYGIMAIEKERQDRENFSLSHNTEDNHEQYKNEEKS